jgi:hypothetical protein
MAGTNSALGLTLRAATAVVAIRCSGVHSGMKIWPNTAQTQRPPERGLSANLQILIGGSGA